MIVEFLEFHDRGLRDLLVVLSVGGTLAVRDGDLIFRGPGPLALGVIVCRLLKVLPRLPIQTIFPVI